MNPVSLSLEIEQGETPERRCESRADGIALRDAERAVAARRGGMSARKGERLSRHAARYRSRVEPRPHLLARCGRGGMGCGEGGPSPPREKRQCRRPILLRDATTAGIYKSASWAVCGNIPRICSSGVVPSLNIETGAKIER